MKVLVDENLPPALARALAALFVDEHQIHHLRDKYGPAVEDREWIKDLHGEGGWLVISGDRRINRNHAERQLFKSSNIVGFFLSKGLNKSPTIKKMERLMALWPTIEKQASLVSGGAMFELPMRSAKLKQV